MVLGRMCFCSICEYILRYLLNTLMVTLVAGRYNHGRLRSDDRTDLELLLVRR